jgi:ubiquinone/menaquinone biosynthesis C-methylase UbiE
MFMSNAEFDRHAASYGEQHRVHIGLSGEEPAYFAEYKMRDFSALAQELGLPPSGTYLDFGCGIGGSISHFRSFLPQAKLLCADVSAESLSLAKEAHADAAQFVWMPEGMLPLEDSSLDGAFACCVFHHIDHAQHVPALAELRRVLKPGGLLMVYEHNPYNPLTVRAVRNCPFDENAVLLTAAALQRTGQAAGFNLHKRDYRVFFPAALAKLRPLEGGLRWLPLGAQYFVSMRK